MACDLYPYASGYIHLNDRTILICKGGSQSYGTNVPGSDLDVRGVFLATPYEYLGFSGYVDTVESKDPIDCSLFELKKFLILAAETNPNILEMLWHDESSYLYVSDAGRKLIDNRELFLSKKCKYTFSGYARGQLKRLNSHYRWITNPPTKPPERADFGLSGVPKMPKDQLDTALNIVKKKLESWTMDTSDIDPAARIGIVEKVTEIMSEMITSEHAVLAERSLGFSDNFIDLLGRERAYREAAQTWKSFCDWQKNRNKERAKLEAVLGYDTKHAMHLIRLLLMAEEILLGKGVIVKRPDAQVLVGIRNGSLTYAQLMDLSEKLTAKVEAAYKISKLPENSDKNEINALCIDIIGDWVC